MYRGEHNSRQTVHTHVDNPSLESLRDEIDRIDGQVVDLLNDRVRAAAEIGKIKSQLGVDAYDPAREEQVFAKIEGRVAFATKAKGRTYVSVEPSN